MERVIRLTSSSERSHSHTAGWNGLPSSGVLRRRCSAASAGSLASAIAQAYPICDDASKAAWGRQRNRLTVAVEVPEWHGVPFEYFDFDNRLRMLPSQLDGCYRRPGEPCLVINHKRT